MAEHGPSDTVGSRGPSVSKEKQFLWTTERSGREFMIGRGCSTLIFLSGELEEAKFLARTRTTEPQNKR